MKTSVLLLNTAVTAALVLLSGCGTTSGYKQADKTGEAINTLRTDVMSVKSGVDASIKALDGLAAAATTNPRPAYETYAKCVDKLEAAANTTKKHADQMRERGNAYFQQWETQLAAVQDAEIRKLAQDRRAKLQESFDGIKKAAEAAKGSFPAYLSDLKDLRTALGSDLTIQGLDAAKGIVKKTKTDGVEVQKHLDELIAELNSVVAAITPAKAPAK